MSELTVELPDFLYQAVKQLAGDDNNSIKQFISLAVAEKVSALSTEKYSQERANRASKGKFETVLANVPDVEAEAIDR